MPDKHKGFSDIRLRSRQRYVDLFVNESSRDVFRRRSQVVSHIRRFFEDRQFMEVETPMMQVIQVVQPHVHLLRITMHWTWNFIYESHLSCS